MPGGTPASPPRAERPRFEPPRGGPRAATAAAAQPAGDAFPPTNENVPNAAPAAAPLAIGGFAELIALAVKKRDLSVKAALERDVRLVRCEDGRLEIALENSAAKTLVNDLARKFSQWTGRRWMVVVSAEAGEPTVKAQNDTRQSELKLGVGADPLVQAVLARFPGAEIVDVRQADAPAAPLGDPEQADLPPEDDASAFGAHGPSDEDEF
jgi:DNA polymerase-3 subunit gamma/tau